MVVVFRLLGIGVLGDGPGWFLLECGEVVGVLRVEGL